MSEMRRTNASRNRWRAVLVGGVLVAGVAAVSTGADARPKPPKGPDFTLTLLHNNDGESQLVNAPNQPDFGGAARFKTLVDSLKRDALRGRDRGVVMISSGDNFLAGSRFQASLDKGVPFYDSIALRAVGYDAMIIGNHEFDFGPDVLADFITGFRGSVPFLSANLDVSAEPSLARLARKRQIVSSTIVRERGERIGIVGATTPALATISSPRGVKVLQDVAGLVQAEIDKMTRWGVDKIIFASHLQNINEDRALIPMLRGVDVAIAGGGDELLANPGDLLVPGDSIAVDPVTGEALTYPILVTGADGNTVPIVTTAGDYKYVGRLVVEFDKKGNVTRIDDSSGPVRVSGVAPDAVSPNRWVQAKVVDPVAAYEAELAATVVADSLVALEGRRDPGVRTQETNLGNLMADSMLTAAQARAAAFGVPVPQIGIQNGGGIRNNSLIPARPLTLKDTFDIAAFANFVSVIPAVERADLKVVLENAVSRLPAADGRFAHVAGFSFTYDVTGTAQVIDVVTGNVTTPGSRIVDVVLDDGTVIVDDGVVQAGPALAVATIDFSARGGDQYRFAAPGTVQFTTLGITYQQALEEHLTVVLNGQVTAADYPEGGEGRIQAV